MKIISAVANVLESVMVYRVLKATKDLRDLKRKIKQKQDDLEKLEEPIPKDYKLHVVANSD